LMATMPGAVSRKPFIQAVKQALNSAGSRL
jgi:hypothetical protein